jgi:hypothetical protein
LKELISKLGRPTLYRLKICVIRENYEHKDEKQNEKLCAFVPSWLIPSKVLVRNLLAAWPRYALRTTHYVLDRQPPCQAKSSTLIVYLQERHHENTNGFIRY